MKLQLVQNVKAYKAIDPQENDGTPIAGEIIDRLGFQSAVFLLNYAASTGTPTTAKAAVTVNHGDAANLSDTAVLATFETVLNVKAKGFTEWFANLASAKRYIQLAVDITYVDGTSPKNVLAASVVLGDKNVGPADSSALEV